MYVRGSFKIKYDNRYRMGVCRFLERLVTKGAKVVGSQTTRCTLALVGWSCDEQHPINLYKYDQWQCRSFELCTRRRRRPRFSSIQLIPQQPLDISEPALSAR